MGWEPHSLPGIKQPEGECEKDESSVIVCSGRKALHNVLSELGNLSWKFSSQMNKQGSLAFLLLQQPLKKAIRRKKVMLLSF